MTNKSKTAGAKRAASTARGAKTAAGAYVSRVSHGTGGGHHLPDPVPAKAAKSLTPRRLWDVDDDPNPFPPKGHRMAANMPHPMYARMDFPEYEFREYPKFIPHEHDPKTGVTVHDEDEERAALAGRKVVREVDEKTRLVALADLNGVQVDKRWSAAKMGEAIEAAGFDPSLDPFA